MDIPDLGVPIWVIITAGVTWAGAAWKYSDIRNERKLERGERKAEKDATAALAVEQHRDDMILTLLATVKEENARALTELAEVREENRALRSLEKHFYHFQQAIDHLEALLSAGHDPDARAVAEKNATAFLERMKRIQQAKGDIQQSIAVIEAAERIEDREQKDDHNQ